MNNLVVDTFRANSRPRYQFKIPINPDRTTIYLRSSSPHETYELSNLSSPFKRTTNYLNETTVATLGINFC